MAIGEDLRLVARDAGLSALERRWVQAQTRRRLHQPVFRAQVIQAYGRRCAICSLRHVELLDAAHIIPDSETGGDAIVTNGLALCKIHHAAYDNNVASTSAESSTWHQPSSPNPTGQCSGSACKACTASRSARYLGLHANTLIPIGCAFALSGSLPGRVEPSRISDGWPCRRRLAPAQGTTHAPRAGH